MAMKTDNVYRVRIKVDGEQVTAIGTTRQEAKRILENLRNSSMFTSRGSWTKVPLNEIYA